MSVEIARIAPGDAGAAESQVHSRLRDLAQGSKLRSIGNLHRVDGGPSWLVIPVEGGYLTIHEVPEGEADTIERALLGRVAS